jgi:Tripartite tricarboxylate transporter TctB family
LSKKQIEIFFSVLIVLFLAWVLWEARNWPAPSRLYPWSLGFTVLGLALMQVVVAWRATLKASENAVLGRELDGEKEKPNLGVNPSVAGDLSLPQDAVRRRTVTICVWIVGFFFGIWFLGFKFGSLGLTFAFLKFTAKETWLISTAIAVGTYLFFWLIFDIALRVPLGSGLIADYFALN